MTRPSGSTGAWAIAAAMALAVLTAGCMPRTEVPAVPDPAHNSRNSVDWPGTYEGVTPCADCPGIRMRLTLHADGRFELSTLYIDRQTVPTTVRGPFRWDAAGGTVTLEGPGDGRQFRVGEGRLLQIGRDGSVPSWDTPYRVLTKQPGA